MNKDKDKEKDAAEQARQDVLDRLTMPGTYEGRRVYKSRAEGMAAVAERKKWLKEHCGAHAKDFGRDEEEKSKSD